MPENSFKYQGANHRQKQVFIAGMGGKKPRIPLDYSELERKAQLKLSIKAFGYIATGAGKGTTKINNRTSFDQTQIKPRIPNLVHEINTKTKILDKTWEWPVFLSPLGVMCLAHKESDRAVAQASNRTDTPFFMSNQASVAMEECAREMQGTLFGFQLYYSKNDALSKSLVQRAEKSGCQYIIVTLDTTKLGWRPMDLQEGFLPFLLGRGLAQYTSDPVFIEQVRNATRDTSSKPPMNFTTILNGLALKRRLNKIVKKHQLGQDGAIKIVQQFIQTFSHPALGWEELEKVKSWTSLPILLKGILHPDDAQEAKNRGFDGLIISNHGGRQVDGSISSLTALRSIRKAVGPDWPLLMDSGVRTGSDVFKALALGANAVGVGRPYAYALALNGAAGIEEYLYNLRAEFELTMSLTGCADIHSINSSKIL